MLRGRGSEWSLCGNMTETRRLTMGWFFKGRIAPGLLNSFWFQGSGLTIFGHKLSSALRPRIIKVLVAAKLSPRSGRYYHLALGKSNGLNYMAPMHLSNSKT